MKPSHLPDLKLGWTAIPNSLILDPLGLHREAMGKAIWLYGWLRSKVTGTDVTASYLVIDHSRAWSYKRIASEIGAFGKDGNTLSPDTVRTWMRRLKANGYVKTKKGNNGIIMYLVPIKRSLPTVQPESGAKAPPMKTATFVMSDD